MKSKAFITVFTPAYNRAHTLPRTYESLRKQEMKNFEWLIVDDGSKDNTRELVQKWIDTEKEFKIRYIYKENGGMHTAYNMAYANIDTELNICIDSDDCLADNAIKIIYDFWQQVKNKGYAGIIGLDADMSGSIIGDRFPKGLKDTSFSEYYGSGNHGDKKFVYITEIVKQFPPYPEYKNERYVGISCLHLLISQQYRLAVLDEILCNVEYQKDGHSTTMFSEYLNSPRGFAYYRKIYMTYPRSFKDLIKNTTHYVAESLIAQNSNYIKESPHKLLTVILTPAGGLLRMYIERKAKGKKV